MANTAVRLYAARSVIMYVPNLLTVDLVRAIGSPSKLPVAFVCLTIFLFVQRQSERLAFPHQEYFYQGYRH
jgi:hypothetical protein